MSEPLQDIYVANGRVQAEIVRGLLEAAEIPVELTQEGAGEVYGLTVGPLGEVHVWVPASRVEEALALVTAMERGELQRPESNITNNGE